mmetsp:Transcript_18487/g.18580  ORF Transcript_18487/g.18580 Transcript_18487/m.18580 type:complete len:304 (+) Transcript_18487:76-987(+)|eukprot:CAMPEP_0182425854 /NCGR_PEP_ID=MMETSP1167-20130531/12351_1 /TAXON_ID=2988 /ORGANISM="Mallomonas Sp, Strain CCMP3275" /LENGTH=303 /DNA_ID=CAMNT_0024606903 /DNA_START=76 /DNA_END=987 /DNA_ORIENTATION=-
MSLTEQDKLDLFNKVAAVVSFLVILVTLAILHFKKKKLVALNSEEWISFTLIKKVDISHDVRLFRFALQSEKHILGLPIGQHISLKFTDTEGKLVQRSYTPVSSDNNVGYVDFVVKVYFAKVHPKFPDGGKMSQYMNNLQIGESMMMKGPKGHLEYLGNGKLKIKRKQVMNTVTVKKIGMVAGGTGITPMLQIINAVLKNPNDKTQLFLLFANQTEDDILLRKELDELHRKHDHLKVWYTVDKAPEGWSYSEGFITADMCRKHLPPADSSTLLLVCGPPPMIKYACEPAFRENGFEETQWFSF